MVENLVLQDHIAQAQEVPPLQDHIQGHQAQEALEDNVNLKPNNYEIFNTYINNMFLCIVW